MSHLKEGSDDRVTISLTGVGIVLLLALTIGLFGQAYLRENRQDELARTVPTLTGGRAEYGFGYEASLDREQPQVVERGNFWQVYCDVLGLPALCMGPKP